MEEIAEDATFKLIVRCSVCPKPVGPVPSIGQTGLHGIVLAQRRGTSKTGSKDRSDQSAPKKWIEILSLKW